MKNSIADRVLDFIKIYPPFNSINNDDLLKIATQISIIYLEKGEAIFKRNDPFENQFYITRNGAISLYHTNINEELEIVNIFDAGDVFGLRPLLAKENYKLTAIANEESILYAVPIEIFQQVTQNNAQVQKFLVTAFATNTFDPYTAEETHKIFADYLPNSTNDMVNFQSIKYSKHPITCAPNATLQEAALKMTAHKISCIIIVSNTSELPLGIITTNDIKSKIATGLYGIDVLVTQIMTPHVITCKKEITIADAQLQMLKHNINHLCITKDGTINSKLIGILTNHDILGSLSNNPSVILKQIKRAERTRTIRNARLKANVLIKNYLDQNIPITHILKIIAQINDAVTQRVIELSIKKMNQAPPTNFAWMTLGSQGRHEQVLFTDQDNAIIFEDVPEADYEHTKSYFLQMAKHATKALNKIGFEYCEADMMASNSEWCKSFSEWKNQFEHWILNPDEKAILLASIFFDFNPVYGDINLTNKLSDVIYNALSHTQLFYKFLAKDILRNPSPLGFFKQFLLEKNGDKKNLFNIKSRALLPLIDAARILVLNHHIKGINNTIDRFEKLCDLEPQNKDLYEACSYAFKALSKFKTKQGLKDNNSGKFIEINNLTKEEQLKLRRCFKPISELQDSLTIKFDLKNFS